MGSEGTTSVAGIARRIVAMGVLVVLAGIVVVSWAQAASHAEPHTSAAAKLASVTTYMDRDSFDAAAGPTRATDFATDDYGLPLTNPSADQGFDYLGLAGICFQNVRSYYNLVIYTFPAATITVDLPAGTYAFGTEISPFYLIDGTYTVTLSTGDVFSFDPALVPWTWDFFGVVSDTPIDWVEFTYDNTYFLLDNFAITATAGPGRGCPAPPFIPVTIDVEPGSVANSVNARSSGVTPVAILATDDFDPLDVLSGVDPATVLFAGAAKAHPDQPLGHWEDVDDDGDIDLVLHFDTQEMFGNPAGLSCGDQVALLTGFTYDGVAIEGTDAVVTVGCMP